jgi:hypothetical protein
MKKQPEYLESSVWYREEIFDPYQVIAGFFSAADVVSHKKSIKNAIIAACSDQICNKKDPSGLMWHFELLESVINAAFIINKEKKQSPLSINNNDLFNPNLFCGWDRGLTAWDFFPRALSLKEYIDPYLVFKRFFKLLTLSEWKRELKDILDHALGITSFAEAGIDFNCLPIYLNLTKLIEAVHLIDVREVNYIGDMIKNRYKKEA